MKCIHVYMFTHTINIHLFSIISYAYNTITVLFDNMNCIFTLPFKRILRSFNKQLSMNKIKYYFIGFDFVRHASNYTRVVKY